MYNIGDKVCLWKERVELGAVTVLKEVMVTITDVKTGAPGEFTDKPSDLQSLRGVGDDGELYEKHWEVWPESQTSDYQDQWSWKQDGNDFWIPKEAFRAYNALQFYCRQTGVDVRHTNEAGAEIRPKGNVEYCSEHNRYSYKDTKCFSCFAKLREKDKK